MPCYSGNIFVLRGPIMAMSAIPQITENKDETQKAVFEQPQ